jgi:hypothetical protein
MYDPQSFPSASAESPSDSQQRQQLIKWGCIAGGGALLIFILSCGLLTYFAWPLIAEEFAITQATPDMPPPPDSPEPEESLVPGGLVSIEEDFEEPTTTWDQSSAQVIDGAYELRIDTTNNDTYGLFLGNGNVQDFDIAVDVQQTAGPATSEYGIRFRQSGPGTYLMFSISGSGYYRLVRVDDQAYESLIPWTFDGRINTGEDTVNRLRVVADGETLETYINGEQVIDTTDEEPAAGQLTLGMVTFDEGGLVVTFDNMEGEAETLDLEEDFSNPEDVPWSIGGARIVSGEYEMFAGGGIQFWQHPLPQGISEVENFVVELDTTMLDAGEGSAYGIIFGDGGAFDYYSLLILPQGGIMLLHSDEEEPLIPPIPLDFVETGTDATNSIRLEIRNSSILQITINGEELPGLQSRQPFEEGMVGLIVVSGLEGRVQVRFDNFQLEEIVEGDSA